MKYLITILLSSFCLSVFGQWSEQTTGTTNHLNAIQFIDENTGFSVGDNGTFLKTTDGGENWTLNMLPLSEQLRGLYFVNSSTGFVCSNSHLYKTTDGGENFTDITAELYLPSAPSSPMHQIRIFFNGDIGIITALWAPIGVFAIKTNDGGASWTEFSVPTAGTGFGDISFSVVNSNIKQPMEV